MSVELDALTVRDAKRCAELEAILYAGDDPWSEEAFVTELAAQHIRYLAARDGSTLVGYAGMSRLGGTEPEYEIHTIGVDPDYQRRGIGRQLLDELLASADADPGPVFLEVRTDNEAALALYRATGFETIGVRKRYYQASGADAYTMQRAARL